MKEYTAFEINCDDCDKGLWAHLSRVCLNAAREAVM